MTTRKLPTEQLEKTERLREPAKAEGDWTNIPPAEAHAITKHPAVRAILEAFPGSNNHSQSARSTNPTPGRGTVHPT
jgi:hypothetical protein